MLTREAPSDRARRVQPAIIAGHVGIGWAVGQKPGHLLVEMPRECDDGRWRLWVPADSVTDDPEGAAAIRALASGDKP